MPTGAITIPYGACQHETAEKQRDTAWRFKNLNNLADCGLPIVQIGFFSEQLTRSEGGAGRTKSLKVAHLRGIGRIDKLTN